MKPYAKKSFLFSIVIFLSASTNAQSTLTADKFATVDGRKMRYQIGGTGNTTVVFESGYGDNLGSWNTIWLRTLFDTIFKFSHSYRRDSRRIQWNRSKFFKHLDWSFLYNVNANVCVEQELHSQN